MAGTGPVFVSYNLTDDIGTPLGDDCAPTAGNPFPGSCLIGMGMDMPEIFTISAQLQPFSGIPAGTILSDDVNVIVHY